MTKRPQLFPQLDIVVNLTIVDEDDFAVRTSHGLNAAINVNDGKSAMAESDLVRAVGSLGEKKARSVGPPMRQKVGVPAKRSLATRLRSGGNPTENSAHAVQPLCVVRRAQFPAGVALPVTAEFRPDRRIRGRANFSSNLRRRPVCGVSLTAPSHTKQERAKAIAASSVGTGDVGFKGACGESIRIDA